MFVLKNKFDRQWLSLNVREWDGVCLFRLGLVLVKRVLLEEKVSSEVSTWYIGTY